MLLHALEIIAIVLGCLFILGFLLTLFVNAALFGFVYEMIRSFMRKRNGGR